MAGRGAVSQSGQGWFPQPWWLIARLRYCRPFTDLSPRSIALSHSLLQVILLATAAIIGAFSEHFSVSFVRSRSWIASFTSLREGALSERISCVKCVPNTSSSSLHSLTRQMDAVSSLKASRAVPLRLAELLFTTRWRKLSFLINTLQRIVETSRVVAAAVLQWCFGHFRILFASSP